MRIAAVSDDGVTISQHFGRASLFVVVTVEEGKVVSREQRSKPGHAQFAGQAHGHEQGHEQWHEPGHEHGSGQHGFDQASRDRHAMMAAPISDCQVLISGGMGTPVYNRATAAGLKVFLTGNRSIDAAVQSYLSGTLDNNPSLVHSH